MKMIKIASTALLSMVVSLLVFVSVVNAQAEKADDEAAKGENIKKDSAALDKEIAAFSQKMADVIKKYELAKAESVQLLPFRMEYDQGEGFIYLQRHSLIKSERYGDIIGIKTKSMKIFTGGDTISKIESVIVERNFTRNNHEKITIIDPSPATEGTDDVIFTHVVNGEEIVKDKKLSEINNSAAFPVANNIKREFYVPHLTYFYYSIMSIAETYVKGRKDTDSLMTEFLIEAKDI
ncbi:MAG: hypothetical protein PF637_08375 [Spirochaetes bacterium]|nr:hypothetical protein [Spirochaetota bacterium]